MRFSWRGICEFAEALSRRVRPAVRPNRAKIRRVESVVDGPALEEIRWTTEAELERTLRPFKEAPDGY